MRQSAIMNSPRSTNRASVRGCDVRYQRIGKGVPLVLVHTLRTQLEYFRPLIEEFDSTRFEVIAIYLPGHGESTAPPT